MHNPDSFFHPRAQLPGRRGQFSALALVALFLTTGLGLAVEEAAYTEAVRQARLSFHWDRMENGIPQMATTPRTLLPDEPLSLTTVIFDSDQPSLYRTLDIQGIERQCVLVATFTRKQDFWLSAASGEDLRLRLDAGYDVFPWVVVGQTLPSYFQQTYSSTLTTANVERRISQSLGMEDRTGQHRVLAFFWTPLELILRPAYSGDITTSIDYAALSKHPDGTYQVDDPSAGGSAFVLQDYDYSYHSGPEGFGDFVEYNQAKTHMPWTGLGATYNWNYLEDGVAGRSLDPDRVSSPIGPSEFVVSAGAWVEFSHFVENDHLYAYLIPEPGGFTLILFSSIILVLRFRRRNGSAA